MGSALGGRYPHVSSASQAAAAEEAATSSALTGPPPIRPKRITKPSSRVVGPS